MTAPTMLTFWLMRRNRYAMPFWWCWLTTEQAQAAFEEMIILGAFVTAALSDDDGRRVREERWTN
jgi:hypothetical protein